MPIAPSNGIELYYETHGDPGDPALLLVNGYTSQLTQWGDGFREALAERGRFVISFDNRDAGLSTHLDGVEVDLDGVLAAWAGGGPMPPVPYDLHTFAADGIGLLDHLGVDRAHVAGSSMGGMIVQQMAIDHPTRVRSLTSIMSTTGETEYTKASPDAMRALMAEASPDRDRYIADTVEQGAVYCSPRYYDRDEATRRTAIAYDRAFYPEGWVRQFAAIRASGDRAAGLRALRIPTLVIHGRQDTLIMPIGGERTAEIVPGANLLLLHDMGHDLPSALWPLVVDAIISHTTRLI